MACALTRSYPAACTFPCVQTSHFNFCTSPRTLSNFPSAPSPPSFLACPPSPCYLNKSGAQAGTDFKNGMVLLFMLLQRAASDVLVHNVLPSLNTNVLRCKQRWC